VVDRCTAHVGLISVHMTCPFKFTTTVCLPPHMALHCSKSVHFTPIPFHAYLSLSLYIYISISIWYHHVGLLLAYDTQLITSLYPCMHASQQKGLGFAASMRPHPSYSSITKQLHDHGVLPKKQATTRITYCDDFRTACR
jgi:hypothetical protein